MFNVVINIPMYLLKSCPDRRWWYHVISRPQLQCYGCQPYHNSSVAIDAVPKSTMLNVVPICQRLVEGKHMSPSVHVQMQC